MILSSTDNNFRISVTSVLAGSEWVCGTVWERSPGTTDLIFSFFFSWFFFKSNGSLCRACKIGMQHRKNRLREKLKKSENLEIHNRFVNLTHQFNYFHASLVFLRLYFQPRYNPLWLTVSVYQLTNTYFFFSTALM